MVDYAIVLTVIRPNSLWSMVNNDYSTLDWQSDDPKPTKKTLDDAWPQVQYDREHATVEAARRARYQAETDGVFFAAQRDGGDLTAWQAAVDQIKADLPYPAPLP
jgi:chlorite dismutase